MKIIRLNAENVKRLHCVEITPKGNIVQVTGKNASGKSSVLDSIWWALGGEKNVQEVPIRKGAESATIRLDLGDMIVERKFGKGASLTVRNKLGSPPGTEDKKLPKYGSPQDLLDGLIGRLSFDPLGFARKKTADQFDELKKVASIDLDITTVEAAIKSDFTKRATANSDLKSFRAQADGMTFDGPEPATIEDVKALAEELQRAAQENARIDSLLKVDAAKATTIKELQRAIEQVDETLAGGIAEINERAQREIEKLTNDAEHSKAKARQSIVDLEQPISIPPKIDTDAIKTRIDVAQKAAQDQQRRAHKKALDRKVVEAEALSKDLTAAIDVRKKQITDAIEAAKMPVPGLSLAEGQVLYNGVPFAQASDAEQLRVSVAIAMAANSQLRIIRIRDGSLLDGDGLKLLGELAAERDYQIWCERVDDSGKVGIVMVDGAVAADHQEDCQSAAGIKENS